MPPGAPSCRSRRSPHRREIAPFAAAVSADVLVGGEDVGAGRLVLLHDPAGNAAWQGTFRCVTFARAEVDPEMVSDPLLAQVGWSWLLDALAGHGAEFVAPSGTVTSVSSESFGGMADEDPSAEVEVRASWTPVLNEGMGLTAHVQAWGELLLYDGGPAPAAGRGGRHPRPSTHAQQPESKPTETVTEPVATDVPAEPESPAPDSPEPESEARLLVAPADGTPEVAETPQQLDATLAALGRRHRTARGRR